MFEISLNKESAAVLLRCLAYGQSSISIAEIKSGEEKIIIHNIQMIRKEICSNLANTIISGINKELEEGE